MPVTGQPAWPVAPGYPAAGGYPPPYGVYPQPYPLAQPYPTAPAYPQPLQPYSYGMPYPWPPVARKPAVRHSPLGWAAVALGALTTVVAVVVALAAVALPRAAVWHSAGELLAPPARDASPDSWNEWARRAADIAVAEQAAALLAGDESAYLAVVDPAATQLRSALRRRYAVLQEMGVGRWSQSVRGRATVTGELSWRADVRVSYCFGEPDCRPNTVVVESQWRLLDDRLVLTDLADSDREQSGPRPWEVTDLAILTGERTVVATSPYLDWRLDQMLEAAERAAAVADRFARWNGPPSRYVVFLANSVDWDAWYGFDKPDWSGGYYVDLTDNEVVVNAAISRPLDMLIHEFTHVATLAGNRDGRLSSTWWLVEGVAEYAAMIDRPVSAYDGFADVRRFVASSWDGDPAVQAPGFGDSLEEAAARYGLGFLTVRRMADVYGEDAMMEFFGLVVHDDVPLDSAAREAFGQSWDTVRADCVAYIRSL